MKTSILASVLLVLSVATAVSAGGATRKAVTYTINWSIPPKVNNQVVKNLNVCVGDSLSFSWRGTHGLAVLPTGVCPKPGTAPAVAWPAKNIIVPTTAAGSKVIKVAKAGTTTYSCQVGLHCVSGQAIRVTAKAC